MSDTPKGVGQVFSGKRLLIEKNWVLQAGQHYSLLVRKIPSQYLPRE